jgi:prepilin-type N-terminal cleavage/methylation domain-containing protein
MKSVSLKNQKGFTLIEILIGVVIFLLLLQLANQVASGYLHQYRITQAASQISVVPQAVQRRNAHDGFLFNLWDENGGTPPTNDDLSWDEDEFEQGLLVDHLVARLHPGCPGVWNPINTGGAPDDGDETGMERTALVGCNELRGTLPFRVQLSALLTADIATNTVGRFVLYINTTNVNFGIKDDPANNIVNFTKLQQALNTQMQDTQNGTSETTFGLRNDLDDLADDVQYTTRECEDALLAGARCDIIMTVDFAGLTLGQYKRINNVDFFTDDVTFGQSIAAGRQECAFWEETGPGVWNREIVDCAIKAGVNDDAVQLVMHTASLNRISLTGDFDGAGGPLSSDADVLCNLFQPEDAAAGNFNLTPTGVETPCGMLVDEDGGNFVVQLLTTDAHIEGTAYIEDVVSSNIYGGLVDIYSDTAGAVVLQVHDDAHNILTFTVQNNGDVFAAGDVTVQGSVEVDQNLDVDRNAVFSMVDNSTVTFGLPGNTMTIARNGPDTMRMTSTGNSFEIISGNEQGITMNTDATNDIEIKLDANNGVITENGTTIHSSFSSLRDEDFNAVGGINTDSLKNLSKLVTADMAKMLDDTSSPIQIVGVDRVEGEFTTINKPDCLSFMDDANYSSPAANPYGHINAGALGNGEDYARLLLIPMYFKTYNSTFGDNQLFAQHAAHASATEWDVFLYLSGEGALGTGAREDGAGGSLALILCDYSSINFSNQTF